MSFPLVAGLGNPGRVHEGTRHNLGWVVLDAFARRHGLAWRLAPEFKAEVARWETGAGPLWLAKPQTFMNASGESVDALARYFKAGSESVIVVHDDLTIDLGLLKVTSGGSAGGHNGVDSLIRHLGPGFARLRLGIGPKRPLEMDLADFVLARFAPDQLAIVTGKIDFFVQGLELLLQRGLEAAMNQLNRRDPK